MVAFASSAKARCPPKAPMARAPSGGFLYPSAKTEACAKMNRRAIVSRVCFFTKMFIIPPFVLFVLFNGRRLESSDKIMGDKIMKRLLV